MERPRAAARMMASLLALGAASVVGACGGGSGDGGTSSTEACGAVELVVAGNGSVTGLTVPSDDGALAAAVATSFCATFTVTSAGATRASVPGVLSSADAHCIGSGLVRELGAVRVRELGFAGHPWSLLGFGLTNHASIRRPEAEQIVGIFEKCSNSWEQLLIRSVTEGSEEISDSSARCTAAKLSDSDARAILASEIDRAYDDPSSTAPPFGVEAQPLFVALEKCLTADERARLDWN